MEFDLPVKSLSYNNEMYVVGTAQSVLCMTLDGHKKIHEIPTGFNLKGLHAISQGQKFCVAAPSKTAGSVNVTFFQKSQGTD